MNELRRDEPLSTSQIVNRDNDRRTAGSGIFDEAGEDRTRDHGLAPESAAAQSHASANPPQTQYDPSVPVQDPALDEGGFWQNRKIGSQSLADTSAGPLFPEEELHHFRARWDQVQASFVDEPQRAVEEADTLVANVVKRITEQFAEERTKLEGQWTRSGNVSTEDLRQGLRRYRALFDRLLAFQPEASRSHGATGHLDAERVA